MYATPNAAVFRVISVPGEAERLASSPMRRVTLSVMFGLMTSSFTERPSFLHLILAPALSQLEALGVAHAGDDVERPRQHLAVGLDRVAAEIHAVQIRMSQSKYETRDARDAH